MTSVKNSTCAFTSRVAMARWCRPFGRPVSFGSMVRTSVSACALACIRHFLSRVGVAKQGRQRRLRVEQLGLALEAIGNGLDGGEAGARDLLARDAPEGVHHLPDVR